MKSPDVVLAPTDRPLPAPVGKPGHTSKHPWEEPSVKGRWTFRRFASPSLPPRIVPPHVVTPAEVPNDFQI